MSAVDHRANFIIILNTMKVADLRAYAKRERITLPPKARKSDIIETITNAMVWK